MVERESSSTVLLWARGKGAVEKQEGKSAGPRFRRAGEAPDSPSTGLSLICSSKQRKSTQSTTTAPKQGRNTCQPTESPPASSATYCHSSLSRLFLLGLSSSLTAAFPSAHPTTPQSMVITHPPVSMSTNSSSSPARTDSFSAAVVDTSHPSSFPCLPVVFLNSSHQDEPHGPDRVAVRSVLEVD